MRGVGGRYQCAQLTEQTVALTLAPPLRADISTVVMWVLRAVLCDMGGRQGRVAVWAGGGRGAWARACVSVRSEAVAEVVPD